MNAREESTPDFPAAHSMDTTWFAVDADGCVGVFDSSEDGAVPNAAATAGFVAEPSFDTFLVEAARLAAALVADPDLLSEWHSQDRTEAQLQKATRLVVVLADPRLIDGPDHHRTSPAMLRTVEDAFPNAGWRVVRAAEPRLLACTEPLAKDLILELERRRDVAAVVLEDDLFEVLEEAGGVFRYDHDYGEQYEPGRYARSKEAPLRPLKLSDLSPADQTHVGKVALPFRFAETERFQLADVMRDEDCAIWAETTLRGEPLAEQQSAARPRTRPTALVRWAIALIVAAVIAIILWRTRHP